MKYLLVIIFFLIGELKSYAGPEATAHLGLEVGISTPQNHLTDYISPKNAARLNLFGGARVDQKGIGSAAVGLGLDLTYADYKLKSDMEGHYRRYLWDWFFLPISLGFLQITPGVSWVVTDVELKDLGIKETSIRPGAVLGVGIRLNILPFLALTAQVRGEKVWEDKEAITVPGSSIDELNITGEYITSTVGIMGYF